MIYLYYTDNITKGVDMDKLNCWEYTRCGRQPGGVNVSEFGICPAAMEKKANGFNDGKNAGRVCWTIANTLGDRKVDRTIVEKLGNCMECDFFKLVSRQEGFNFKGLQDVLPELKIEE
jgi:eukaryotic-like serine/threonine-protein kinase